MKSGDAREDAQMQVQIGAPRAGAWDLKSRRWRVFGLVLVCLGWVGWLGWVKGGSDGRVEGTGVGVGPGEGWERLRTKEFSWSEIEASETLSFHPCFDKFECAKLKLPLDHFNDTAPGKTVSIALAKLPAKVSVDDPRYGGPILINPGGPGGSGIRLALQEARDLQDIVDVSTNPLSLPSCTEKVATSAKYFDIIGFDPRGIGNTEPPASCMPDQASWWSWRLRESNEGILGSSDAVLGRLWSMEHSYGRSCKVHTDDEHDIKRYMTTASVARDMLEIAERHSEYVSGQVDALHSAARGETCANKETTTFTPGSTKLQYWGFSYGTFLGATFASMYPSNIGRLVLDGVVNADDYLHGLGGDTLHDTEKTMTSFYTYCMLAGPQACPLSMAASSIADIEYRVHAIIDSLYHAPLPLLAPDGPEVFEWSDLKNLVFGALYTPALSFPFLAQVLLAVENGTQSGMLVDVARELRGKRTYSCKSDSSLPLTDPSLPQSVIMCSDGVPLANESIAEFEEFWHAQEALSPTVGSIWSRLRLACTAWAIAPVFKFMGPFGGKTSWPILWLSNTADPVTPLKSARAMAERFEGSGLVVQDAAGHCTSALPTTCTISHIRAYMQHGIIPPPNTFCRPDSSDPATALFALNSTDPGSLFYDAELATVDEVDVDGIVGELGEGVMDAARRVQGWVAKERIWGSGGWRIGGYI